MKLSLLLRELALGELSNLSYVEDYQIVDDRIPQVILAINGALRDLFSRVHLRESELTVQTLDWKVLYPLRVEHAVTNPTPGLKYILDTPARPYTGDLVKIVSVTNEIGLQLPINDVEDWASVFLPTQDTVQFNHPGAGQVFFVQYQALHPVVKDAGDGILEQDIHIPEALIELLRMKVAYNLISPMAGQEFSIRAQMLDASYESKLAMVVTQNDVSDQGVSTNTKLHKRGYP